MEGVYFHCNRIVRGVNYDGKNTRRTNTSFYRFISNLCRDVSAMNAKIKEMIDKIINATPKK